MISKKSLPIILSIFFTISIINLGVFSKAATPSEAAVKVEPERIELGNSKGDPIPPGTQFNVSIKIYNVTNLYGFDLKFKWNTTYLEYLSHSVHVPKDTYTDGVLWNPILPLANKVNTTEGTYWIAYSSLAPAPTFNGSGTVFTMTFEVKNQPYDYETGGTGYVEFKLDFLSTDLAAFGGDPIPHNRSYAVIRIWGKRSESPPSITLKVAPTKVEGIPINNIFEINIWISNVNQTYEIANFSITLNFNSTLIKALNITEGPWPESYANSSKQILNTINNEEGTATFALQLIPPLKDNRPAAGILFTVTFKVTYEPTEYPPPTCELTLEPAIIFDKNMGLIKPIVENGIYTAFRTPPTAKFTWSPKGKILPKGQIITFNASESYHPLGIKLYTWDFGDGNKTSVPDPVITHIYKETGTVTVVLNVTDKGDFWAVTSVTLYVIDEPENPPTIAAINPLTKDTNFKFYTNTTSIGSRFNITINVYNVADLQTYQICLEYNSTFLKATRAWIPTWEKEWVFHGKTTTEIQPTFGSNYVQISAAIQGNYPTFSGNGLLCIIELEIIHAPTIGEVSCNLNINNKDTFLLNSNQSEISAIKIDGYYVCIFTKLNSLIILNVSPEKIALGSSVIISGTLIPAKPNVNITIEYQLEGQNDWTLIIIKSTDKNGNFNYTWTPPKAGKYTIRGSWSGDQNTNPSKSEVKIEVEAPPTGQEPLYIVGAAAAITTVALGVYLWIRKRK
jgi:hypothetical protein